MYLLIAVVSVWTHESCCSRQLLTSPSFSASVIRRLLTINQQKLSAQVGLTGRTLQVEAGTSSEERRNVSWWVQFFSLLAYKQFMSLRLSSDEGSWGPACRLCCCWHVQKFNTNVNAAAESTRKRRFLLRPLSSFSVFPQSFFLRIYEIMYKKYLYNTLKGQFTPRFNIFSPAVLKVFIHVDASGVSCRVLEISDGEKSRDNPR